MPCCHHEALRTPLLSTMPARAAPLPRLHNGLTLAQRRRGGRLKFEVIL